MSAKEAVSVESAWEKVVAKYREVCVLRRESRLAESERVLKDDLPGVIAAWSAANPQPIAAKKAGLEAMFAVERKRVDETRMLQRMLTAQMNEQMLPAMHARVAEEVKNLFAEQMRSFQLAATAESKGAARTVASMIPENFAVPLNAAPLGLPLPAAMPTRRKPNFNLARAA